MTTREENYLTHRGRPEQSVRMRIGLDRCGRLLAVDCDTVQRGGAHSGYSIVTIVYSGSLLYALYGIENVRYQGLATLLGAPLDDAALDTLVTLARRQVMAMRTTFTSGHYRRRIAGVLARRLVARLVAR